MFLSSQLVLLRVGEHRFGIPILDVREVLPPKELTRLPGESEAVAGLLNVRGTVLTILDFGRMLGLEGSVGIPGSRIVVVDDGTRRAGLVVHEVTELAEAPGESVDTSKEALAVFAVNRPYLVGVGEAEGEPFAVVDVERLMDNWFG